MTESRQGLLLQNVDVVDEMRHCWLSGDSDGRERAAHCHKRKQLKAIRRNADANQHADLNQPLIPVSKLPSCV